VLLGIDRLRGQLDDGLEAALELSKELETSDLAECLRERARINGALGNLEDASADYRRAIDLFEAAGELWEAQRTRIEASGS
jgi:tetratricopeptide (TPR) repeat protein